MFVEIDGYDGAYSISSSGQVMSNAREKRVKGCGVGFVSPSIKQHQVNNCGYAVVRLYKNSKVKTHLVHRLVAAAFLLNDEGKLQVNHIDGNKLNNDVSNLEWVTGSENCRHAIDSGLYEVARGERRASSKLTSKDVLCILQRISEGESHKSIASDFPVTAKTIGKISRGETWSHVSLP